MTEFAEKSIWETDYDEVALENELRQNHHIRERDIETLFRKVSEILDREPNVLYLDSPIIVCGDIHGQMLDLFSLFKTSLDGRSFKDANVKYLFLGDYVDRGFSSIETFVYLAFLKVRYPDKIYLLRGNHEGRQVNQMYGLFTDCMMLYGHSGLWFRINDVFDLLPVAAVIDKRVFCVHGGLSPHIALIEQICVLQRKRDLEGGPISDLTWSDPDTVTTFRENRRGTGYLFGEQQTKRFLLNNKLMKQDDKTTPTDPRHGFIARSHQVAMKGFDWKHDDRLVIVWSAPNYMYTQNNEATFMTVNNEVGSKFTLFEKDPKSHLKPEDVVIEYFA